MEPPSRPPGSAGASQTALVLAPSHPCRQRVVVVVVDDDDDVGAAANRQWAATWLEPSTCRAGALAMTHGTCRPIGPP